MGFFGVVANAIRKVGNWIRNGIKKVFNTIRSFFINIISWIDRAYNKIESKINNAINCSQFFLRKIDGSIKNISYNYVKLENNQWERYTTMTTQNLHVSEVPEEFREKARIMQEREELDITNSVQKELNLVL